MMRDSWNHIKIIIKRCLNPGIYQLWIKPLDAEIHDSKLKLTAPNDFVAAWVRDRLLDVITDCAAQVLGSEPEVEVVAGNKKAKSASRVVAHPLALPMNDKPGQRAVNGWRHCFEEFVVGPCNELAYAASQGVCRQTLGSDKLFLSADPGLGKTHLLHAIGHEFYKSANKTRLRVVYLTAEEFASRMIFALRTKDMSRFKAVFREEVDVLLLEDIHFLQGKEKIQDELLATVKSLENSGKKVVFTSSFMPRELVNMDSQLSSRLSSCFLALIGKPDFETKLRILDSKARNYRVSLPRDVGNLLAETMSSDVRQLESCLHNLILKARLLNSRISMNLAREVLSDFEHAVSRPDLEKIINFICRCFDLSGNDLTSKSRKRQIVLARNTAFFLARKHTDLSLKDIGERFQRRHSTVIKGITGVEREMRMETPLGRQLTTAVKKFDTVLDASARTEHG